MASGKGSRRDQSNNFRWARSLGSTQQISSALSSFQFAQQMFQILQTGDAADLLAPQHAPQQNHQTTVGNRQISHEDRAPSTASSSRSRAKQVPDGAIEIPHAVSLMDCFIDIAVEEVNAKNLTVGVMNEHPTSNTEYRYETSCSIGHL